MDQLHISPLKDIIQNQKKELKRYKNKRNRKKKKMGGHTFRKGGSHKSDGLSSVGASKSPDASEEG